MSQVKWVARTRLCGRSDDVGEGEVPIQVVPLAALVEVVERLQRIVGQAHGGAMLGGDDAYESRLAIEVLAQRLLAQVGEVK